VWGFESLRGHQNIKGRLMKINRPFAFWGSRARHLHTRKKQSASRYATSPSSTAKFKARNKIATSINPNYAAQQQTKPT
jgi:hypothetical protein